MNSDSIKTFTKYIVEGLAVAVAAHLLGKSATVNEAIMLGFVAATTFLILDRMAPSVANGARLGAGMGLGMGLSGTSVTANAAGGAVVSSEGMSNYDSDDDMDDNDNMDY